jgi:ectoine hydroxylase-related dioxygenase (phytanoyl-CoA dioxygenase family)
MTIAQIQQNITNRGYHIIPNLIDRTLTHQLIQAIATQINSDNLKPHGIRNLLTLVSAVRELANSEIVLPIVQTILGSNAKVVRGIFFDKTPEANWKVPWHQDLTMALQQKIELPGYSAWSIKAGIHHVQPPLKILEQMLTVRIHLDAADESNGALRVIPGSHRSGKIPQPEISHHTNFSITCCVNSGDTLLMRPLLLHASSPANSPNHRRVIHLEYCSADLPVELNWKI